MALIPSPATRPLTDAELIELEASMKRHPAGKQRTVDVHRCPTCGQRPSGALGDPELSLL